MFNEIKYGINHRRKRRLYYGDFLKEYETQHHSEHFKSDGFDDYYNRLGRFSEDLDIDQNSSSEEQNDPSQPSDPQT